MFMQFLDQRIDWEILNDVQHVPWVALDIVVEIHQHIIRIAFQPGKIVSGAVEELQTSLIQDNGCGVNPSPVLFIEFVNFILLWLQNTIQTPHDDKRQNNPPVFTGLEQPEVLFIYCFICLGGELKISVYRFYRLLTGFDLNFRNFTNAGKMILKFFISCLEPLYNQCKC